MENELSTNRVNLQGVVLEAPVFSHKSYGEVFYSFPMGIDRKSGYRDVIPVVVSERLIWNMSFEEERKVAVSGQIRTYNEMEEGRNRLNVVVFAREFEDRSGGSDRFYESQEYDLENTANDPEAQGQERGCQEFVHENKVCLEGFLCKKPIRRVSPLGREICDMMVAVNRMYNKSDYIPCIAWGRNAGYAGSLEVGHRISLSGRIQSREYRKKDEEGNVSVKVAYEVSILKIEE